MAMASDPDHQQMVDSFHTLYQVFTLLGVDPNRLEVNYKYGPDEDHIVSLALPDMKIAILTDEDDDWEADYLNEEGWKTFRVKTGDILRFHGIFNQFVEIIRADKLRRMSDTDKTTSSHEEKLLEEILRRNLPAPDRNFKFMKDSGRELTTPDFTWVDYKVAFFVDGLWWHVSMDDKDRLATLRDSENESDLMEMNRTRAERDSENRSVLASRGWIILSCTDRDLDKPEGVRAKANLIFQTLSRIDKQRRESNSIVGDLDFSKSKKKKQEPEVEVETVPKKQVDHNDTSEVVDNSPISEVVVPPAPTKKPETKKPAQRKIILEDIL